MKRSTFLQLPLLGAAGIVSAQNGNAKDPGKGFMVSKGNDRFNKPLIIHEGDTFHTKVSSEDTNGDLFILETTKFNKGGPRLHVHPDQDEWFYVVEGEFKIKVGDDLFNAKAGDAVFGPKKVPHTFSKTNEGQGTLMLIYQPAGKIEQYFKAAGEGKVSKMSEEEANKFRRKHGFELIGPALDHEKQLPKANHKL